jgi:hypothetical protein
MTLSRYTLRIIAVLSQALPKNYCSDEKNFKMPMMKAVEQLFGLGDGFTTPVRTWVNAACRGITHHSRHQQLLASTGRIIDAHYTVDAACLVRSNVVTPVTPRFVAAG